MDLRGADQISPLAGLMGDATLLLEMLTNHPVLASIAIMVRGGEGYMRRGEGGGRIGASGDRNGRGGWEACAGIDRHGGRGCEGGKAGDGRGEHGGARGAD